MKDVPKRKQRNQDRDRSKASKARKTGKPVVLVKRWDPDAPGGYRDCSPETDEVRR